MQLPRACRLLAPLVLVSLAACGGGGGGASGGSGAATAADVFLTDAPADDLLGFQAELASLRLRRLDQTLTADLLVAPITLDFLELRGLLSWIVSGRVPVGTYDAAVIDFTPSSYVAIAEDGSPVTVSAVDDRWVAPFAMPLTFDETSYQRLEIDLRLDDSLTGDVGSGMIGFEATGGATGSSGAGTSAIDEVRARLVSVDAVAGRLVVDAFLDEALAVPLGELDVAVSGTTLLLDEDGSAFASAAAFYAAVTPGVSVLEVHGRVGAQGLVQAERIEVEDSLGSGGLVVVEIEGQVADVDPGNGFSLLIRQIEKGASIAAPVLAGLGDPATIEVSFDGSTVFLLHDDATGDELTDDSSLAVGQRVDVKFATFASSPFPAFKVEIEDEETENEGTVVDAGGLPTSFVMHVNASQPAVVSGAIASSSTDVVVDASQASFELQVRNDPPLEAGDVLDGMRVEVHGDLGGSPSMPTIGASLVRVKPGKLDDAVVTSVDAGGAFSTAGGTIEDPFGGGVSAGPLTHLVASGAVFDGDADSLLEMVALFNGLTGNETLRVDVDGIATFSPTIVEAWEIRVKVEN